MRHSNFVSVFFAALLVFLTVSPAFAQSNGSADTLFKTIQALDTQLFDANNHCDLATMSSMVSDDLEFYHDKTGLAVGKQVFIEAIKNNICGKVTRELVAGSLEVYPLANYGAVEIGIHRFHHPGTPAMSERPSSSTSGTTRTASGWIPGSSATTTSP